MTNQPLGIERAQYAVALQDGYIKLAAKPDAAVRGGILPSGLKLADLNVLEPGTPLVHAPYVLVSFGQYRGGAVKAPGIIGARQSHQSIVIGDSGGYQYIREPFLGDASRWQSLRWLEENSQLAMTLDIPTRAIGLNSQFPTFESCLSVTLQNLDFIERNRIGAARHLNVLQGRDRREINRWYDAVKLRPFDGWAFGGGTRTVSEFVRLVTMMLAEGLLGPDRAHIHVLGTSTASMAVLLTAVQTGVRQQLRLPNFRVTFDTSSPSQMMMRGKGYGGFIADGKQFSIAARPLPDSYVYRGSALPFPFTDSAVGRLLTLGDLCVAPGHVKAGAWDELSNAIVTNHNLERMLAAFEQANRLADLAPALGSNAGRGFQGDYLPAGLLNALAAVRRVFAAADPLSQYKREGAAVWGGTLPTLSDDDMEER